MPTRDIVEPGRSGWLVPPGDVDALADAILAISADPETARRTGESGRELAATRFSWERVTADLNAAYRSAIERRRGRADLPELHRG